MPVCVAANCFMVESCEHRPARLCLSSSLSLDGGGDAGVRGFEHVDVDRVSGGDQERDR